MTHILEYGDSPDTAAFNALNPVVRIVFNRILGGYFVVRGSHDTPISGRFESRAAAKAWLARR